VNHSRGRVGGAAVEVVEAIVGALYLNLLSTKPVIIDTCFAARTIARKGATRKNVTPEIALLDFCCFRHDSRVFM
jgi:hypothetical protein